MVYTARINEYVHNAATTQGPEVEGAEAEESEVKAKVVTTRAKASAKKNEDAETK